MQFPHYFHLFGWRIHPHLVLELIAYSGGFQLYLQLRRRSLWPRAAVPFEQNLWLIVGCVFGALFGAKGLALLESINLYRGLLNDPRTWLAGKTIVGGLLGGWVGVEIVKGIFRIRHSTGDLFVFPLIFGIAVGRVGCFLTGLPDHTYGVHSDRPWAVDFGDGPRHPTQLYEIVFLLAWGIVLAILVRQLKPTNGVLFRLFLLGYLLFRFFVEFIKPRYNPYLGLSAIQVACAIGAGVCLVQLIGKRRNNNYGQSTAAAAA